MLAGDYILLIDSIQANVTIINLPLEVQGRTYWHNFLILAAEPADARLAASAQLVRVRLDDETEVELPLMAVNIVSES